MVRGMSFTGFPKGGVNFFRQLAVLQDREWFKAHKADYEALWQQPMTELFDELHARLQRTFPGVKRSRPKVFRIYRDVRFSKDKAPFKTECAAVLALYPSAAGLESATGFYCSFGETPYVAAGRWRLDGPQLQRFRMVVADDKTGAPVAAFLKKLEQRGFKVAAHEALKRPPPGVDQAHPRVELLKLKGCAVEFPPRTVAQLADGKKLVDGLVKDVEQAAPLLRWAEALARGKPLPKL